MLVKTGTERIKTPQGGANRKCIPVDMVKKKRAQKPTCAKMNLINPTGLLMEVVDVRTETTVEGRDILMMEPVKRRSW